MRFGSRFLLSAALVACIAGVSRADVKKRWELTFDHERPEHFTFRSPMGHEKNFWYFVYTVTNYGCNNDGAPSYAGSLVRRVKPLPSGFIT